MVFGQTWFAGVQLDVTDVQVGAIPLTATTRVIVPLTEFLATTDHAHCLEAV